MADSVSVTSHHSYGSRVGNSFRNIWWWILLVVISIGLLVWNENNYVKEKASLNEWASIIQEASITQIDPSLEWTAVHLYGKTASNADSLQDNAFWIVTDDLKLKRTVEMYQWYEESSEHCTDNLWWSEDCTTTYNYHKKWSDERINSNSFYESNGHSNPSNWAYDSTEQTKSPITLWVYTLSTAFTSQLRNYTTINLSEQNINTPEQYTDSDNFHIQNDYIYIWKSPSDPTVWDLKITFSSVKPWSISIAWKQVWNELTNYTTSNGRSFALLEQWNVTADDMFQRAQQANKEMTWIIRFVGLVLMFLGFSMMLQFLETIAKVVPFLSKVVGAGTGVIALCLTLILWFIVIWLAWIAVRPVIWISCLVVAAAWIFLLSKSKKNKKEKNPEFPEQAKPENPEPTEVIEL